MLGLVFDCKAETSGIAACPKEAGRIVGETVFVECANTAGIQICAAP